MPDDASTADTTTDTTADVTAVTDGKTFTQEQVNTFLAEQKRKIGDVKELRAAAAELATIKESQKSEAEKVTDRLAAADAQVASVPAKVSEALRAHLVALHDINDEDAELFLTATDPQVLLKQVDRLIARGSEHDAQKRKQGNFVSKEGTTTSAPENEERAFARDLFAG